MLEFDKGRIKFGLALTDSARDLPMEGWKKTQKEPLPTKPKGNNDGKKST
jgi:hypothetical protein